MPVATPTLAITDLANGTGATATVSGATGGTTNTLYSQSVDGEIGTSTWTSRGSRSGNGSISVALTTMGYYWWKLVSTDGSTADVSNLVYQPLTNGSDAIHERLMSAIQSRLQGLTFAAMTSPAGSISSSDIVIKKVAIDREGHIPNKPCIIIAPVNREKINHAGGTNIRDEVSYPVGVVIVAADNQQLTTNRAVFLKWREQVVRALENFRPTAVTEINRVTVDPEAIFPVPQWLKNLVASAVVANGVAWQSRGLT